MSSDTRILRLMIIYNVSGYSVLGNPLIRDPRRRLHGKAISCVANQWKGSREMQVGDAWQRQEETGSRGIGKEEREEERGEASEYEKHRVKRQGERTRWSARRRGNIRRQSPGREFGPFHKAATSSLSFIRINLLNVSPTITHAIKLTAL